MTAILGLIPSWLWRWLALIAVAAAFGWTCYLKGEAHVQEQFDAFEAQVKAAGDRQNELTQQTIKVHKLLQENADAQAQTATASRDAAMLRVRALESAAASSRILPAPAPGTASGNRICFAADQLDRGIRVSLAAAQERFAAIAQSGQRGVDTAVVCSAWAKSLAKP